MKALSIGMGSWGIYIFSIKLIIARPNNIHLHAIRSELVFLGLKPRIVLILRQVSRE